MANAPPAGSGASAVARCGLAARLRPGLEVAVSEVPPVRRAPWSWTWKTETQGRTPFRVAGRCWAVVGGVALWAPPPHRHPHHRATRKQLHPETRSAWGPPPTPYGGAPTRLSRVPWTGWLSGWTRQARPVPGWVRAAAEQAHSRVTDRGELWWRGSIWAPCRLFPSPDKCPSVKGQALNLGWGSEDQQRFATQQVCPSESKGAILWNFSEKRLTVWVGRG